MNTFTMLPVARGLAPGGLLVSYNDDDDDDDDDDVFLF